MRLLFRIFALATGATFSGSGLMAGSWTLEAGAARVAVDGVRTFAVPHQKLAHNDTLHATAGSLRLGRDLSDTWNVGVGYTGYTTFRASGFSPNSDIFDRGGGAFLAIVPLEIANRVQEWTFDARYRW